MKRLALLLFASVAMLCASAIERPPLAIGFSYDYASEYGQSGFGIKLQGRIGNHIRIEPEMIYMGERKDVTTLHLNLNVHYVMPVVQRLSLYPFAGLGYSHWGYVGPNVNRWGLNLGAGLEYNIGRNWDVFGELRLHAVKQETQVLTALGLKYNF